MPYTLDNELQSEAAISSSITIAAAQGCRVDVIVLVHILICAGDRVVLVNNAHKLEEFFDGDLREEDAEERDKHRADETGDEVEEADHGRDRHQQQERPADERGPERAQHKLCHHTHVHDHP